MIFFHRELKKTETKETATIRSKSISTLKNVSHCDLPEYHVMYNLFYAGWPEDQEFDQ